MEPKLEKLNILEGAGAVDGKTPKNGSQESGARKNYKYGSQGPVAGEKIYRLPNTELYT